jgi:hypothetical protein
MGMESCNNIKPCDYEESQASVCSAAFRISNRSINWMHNQGPKINSFLSIIWLFNIAMENHHNKWMFYWENHL